MGSHHLSRSQVTDAAKYDELHEYLKATDVESSAIPLDLEACAALYLSALADRKMLIVIDNA